MSPNCLQTLLWPNWLKTNVAVAFVRKKCRCRTKFYNRVISDVIN